MNNIIIGNNNDYSILNEKNKSILNYIDGAFDIETFDTFEKYKESENWEIEYYKKGCEK